MIPPEAIEAAARAMRRTVSSIEELNDLPGGSVLLDSDESVLEKSYIEPRWWFQMGSSDSVSIDDIRLPAAVLHEPTP